MDRLLTAQEVADTLGIPLQSLYRWRVEGKGPAAVKVGKHLRFQPRAVSEWIESQTEARA